MEAPGEQPDPFLDALDGLGPALLAALAALEHARRRLHPPDLPSLRASMRVFAEKLDAALAAFRKADAPEDLGDLCERLDRTSTLALDAAVGFAEETSGALAVPRLLAAMRAHAQAQEALYPLRNAFPAVSRFFVEPALHGRIDSLEPDPPEGASVGLHDANNALDARGGFSLYVPETYDGGCPWPLVVALHGGGGHGREFLWTWLREARGRRFLLLAPTARGSTWSLAGADVDGAALRSMVNYVCERWAVDREHVLLTGLSDGATYTLLCGLQPDSPFTALAPVSGVLHPANLVEGRLDGARGRRIYLVHGALDWMFPVAIAHVARDALTGAGAELVYREIADLSHTYPREENGRILSWFDPRLALDGQGA